MNRLRPVAAPAIGGPDPGRRWPQALLDLLATRDAVVRVVLARLRGSAPREAGAAMLVTADACIGSIGGGYLEWDATAAARLLLAAPDLDGKLMRHRLGLELAQCCGGVVELWIERWTAADRPLLAAAVTAAARTTPMLLDSRLDHRCRIQRQLRPADRDQRLQLQIDDADGGARLVERLDIAPAPLWLFGAGHVGRALVPILAGLPFRLDWLDSRAGIFPDGLADDIAVRVLDEPAAAIADAPPGCRYLVMTHDHRIDYALCRAILARGDAAFVGMIGSQSKAARFRLRLAREGLDAGTIACPVGIAGIASKEPAAIAIGIAAQLLQGLAPAPSAAPAADDGCRIDRDHGCASCGTRRAPASP